MKTFEARVLTERRELEQFGRIWIHTHPGESAEPSQTDEETFARVFGNCDWALMFILARGGATYARLRFNVGLCGEMELPVQVDYRQSFPAALQDSWQWEYDSCVDGHDDSAWKSLGEIRSQRDFWSQGVDPEQMFPELVAGGWDEY